MDQKTNKSKLKIIIPIAVAVVVIAGIVVGIVASNNSKEKGTIEKTNTQTINTLKLTDSMIQDIESKVDRISPTDEVGTLQLTFKNLGYTNIDVNEVKILSQDLKDAYTYAVYLKATGVNKADYFNYELNYTAVEDSSNSKGYRIEKHYKFD